MLHLLVDWEYPHWMMMAGGILVALGFIGFAFHQNRNGPVNDESARARESTPTERLGGVDSRDSLLGANQIQGCFWGGCLGCDGTVGFERRGVGADSAADHRPA